MFHRWVARLTDDDLTQKFLYATREEAEKKYKKITFDKQALG
jgi:hypothetical protein